MKPLLESILEVNASGHPNQLVALLSKHAFAPEEGLRALETLVAQSQVSAVYILAMGMANRGVRDARISLVLATLGLLFDNPTEVERGLRPLAGQVDAASDAERITLFHFALSLVLIFLSCQTHQPELQEKLPRLLEVVQGAMPHFRRIFDPTTAVAPLTPEALQRQGRAGAGLVIPPLPAAGRRRLRRVMVLCAMIMGARVAAGMRAYGWEVERMARPATAQARAEVVQACVRADVEVLVMEMMQVDESIWHLLTKLRAWKPSLRIVLFTTDAWTLHRRILGDTTPVTNGSVETHMQAGIKALAGLVDVFWECDMPSLAMWREPEFRRKVLHAPLPHGVPPRAPEHPLRPLLFFAGGYKGYTWPRAFWLAGAPGWGLPIEARPHSTETDGLPILDSYAIHFQRLAEATCCLNLTMRENMRCIVTHRAFEAPLAGALLLNEQGANADMERFFVAWEHYLPFETLADLRAILRFITEHPRQAETIRRNGCAFAQEHYGDDKLVGYLDAFLDDPWVA
ncbi:MAG: glycosyltransferase family 1 protein [Magnetococcales bacterium]|nr:glycosyltransferase family 1 protein [Magnetococcales bacterium]